MKAPQQPFGVIKPQSILDQELPKSEDELIADVKEQKEDFPTLKADITEKTELERAQQILNKLEKQAKDQANNYAKEAHQKMLQGANAAPGLNEHGRTLGDNFGSYQEYEADAKKSWEIADAS